ncbi:MULTISPECIES: nucleotidyltransferase domain-containing protein [Serratia]|nr:MULTISPECIES: nucleotidyltransferase domain-containing protein [Serratia]MDI9109383.1 nucleotidyltransferase domain-containing protein [Serratia marcescens]MDR8490842.1 nucleotidyltransferase domain-containing protein [Serratia nevei]MDR8534002.1 nucleotidyltransferase domain-containing protein [Serratia nevei]
MGLIPTVTAFPLQQAFIPLLEALTSGLPCQFPALIHSIYLYGSVARGEAIPGVSDLDITLLLTKPADSEALQRLEAWRQAFQLEQRIVSKVDFDIGSVDEALKPEHHDSWGFWLKHHCRCLWGEDVSAAFPPFRPDRRMARAVNADLRCVLARYREQLLQARPEPDEKRLKREAARKLIRATNMLRAEGSAFWPTTLTDYAEQLLARYPAQQADMTYLLAHAVGEANDAAFADRMMDFLAWMEGQR